MFSVSGAGTFLSEVVSNAYEANVETKYKTTPISQRIRDINIDKTYPEECQSDRYTHVVSGVTLGLEAYMTFKFEAQKESDANQVAGEMEIIVKNIPNFSVSGQGTIDLSQSQQEIINKTVITAFGDFSPREAFKIEKKSGNLITFFFFWKKSNAHSFSFEISP